MSHWSECPLELEYWDENVDTIMAIDENGTIDLKGIMKNIVNIYNDINHDDRWFTITGVIMNKSDFPKFKEDINIIKYKHWEDGCFNYKTGKKRVVFHSREIRKKIGPFNPKIIKYDELIFDINNLVKKTPFTIFSSSIDKAKHILKYVKPYPIYNLCLNFIIERYCMYLNKRNQTGIIILESRGKKENKMVLDFLNNLIENGNNYFDSSEFSCIKGIYFNPKWSKSCNDKMSYILLELADLVSYPIYKYSKLRKKDKAFLLFEDKIFNYPETIGFGLKIFP